MIDVATTIKILEHIKNAGYDVQTKALIDVTDKSGKLVFTIYPDDKYLELKDEFAQIGPDIHIVKSLIEDFNFRSNVD